MRLISSGNYASNSLCTRTQVGFHTGIRGVSTVLMKVLLRSARTSSFWVTWCLTLVVALWQPAILSRYSLHPKVLRWFITIVRRWGLLLSALRQWDGDARTLLLLIQLLKLLIHSLACRACMWGALVARASRRLGVKRIIVLRSCF